MVSINRLLWKVLCNGVLKINIDDAFDISSKRHGVQGLVVVEIAEARAVLLGLSLVVDKGRSSVVVESNSLSVVNLCKGLYSMVYSKGL
ncbi:hypothetical protein QYF36_021342 [Acer negundo]|nr:hypothetical protein QYF36_021342 [Acer negundo]